MTETVNVWPTIRSELKKSVNPMTFQTWLSSCVYALPLNGNGKLTLSVPSDEFSDYIETNFKAAILRIASDHRFTILEIEYILQSTCAREPEPEIPNTSEEPEDEPFAFLDFPDLPDICWRAETKTYLDLVAPCSHSTDAFHLTCFLTLFGALLSKSVHISLPHITYPNLYSMLTGISGISGKTTALKWITELFLESEHPVARNIIKIEDLDSGEGLIEEIKNRMETVERRDLATALIMVDEFNSVLRKSRGEASKLTPIIKKAYDTRNILPHYTAGNRFELKNPPPFVGLFGIEIADLADMDERDIRGGLGNRNLYVAGKPKPPDFESMFRQPDPKAWKALVDRVMRKAAYWQKRKSTDLFMSEELMKGRWKKFFDSHYERGADNEKIRQLSVRDPTHVAKIAMIYCALDAAGNEILEEHLIASIAFLDYCLACRYKIFSEVGTKPWVKDERDIIGYVKRQGNPVPHRAARRRFTQIGLETWERYMNHLVADEKHEDRPLRWVFFEGKRGRQIRHLAINY